MNHWLEADPDELDEDVVAEWSDRGGIIRFEEDESEEFVGEVPLGRILAVTNPLTDPPWHDGTEVCETGVAAALAERRFERQPYSSDMTTVAREDWTSRRHEERIAWLLANPSPDPIEVEISAYGDAEVDDGMHRLYAAAMRRDETVLIRIGGFIDHSPQVLGVVCVFPEMAEDVSEVVAL
jgi:hypothetical protein